MSAAAGETVLLYILLPLWILAGAGDWLCHYRTNIERTAGWKESALHLALLAVAGLPVLLGLLCQINGLVLLIMLGCFVVHELIGYLDVRYAIRYRHVGAAEQKLHDYMVAAPVAALAVVAVMHWPSALSIFGLGPEPFDGALRWKPDPLPAPVVGGILAAIVLFNALPYLQEMLRALRAARRRDASEAQERSPPQSVESLVDRGRSNDPI